MKINDETFQKFHFLDFPEQQFDWSELFANFQKEIPDHPYGIPDYPYGIPDYPYGNQVI